MRVFDLIARQRTPARSTGGCYTGATISGRLTLSTADMPDINVSLKRKREASQMVLQNSPPATDRTARRFLMSGQPPW